MTNYTRTPISGGPAPEIGQAAELSSRLWSIANDLRGNMDASKFKDYILSLIFYRYLSELAKNRAETELLSSSGLSYEEMFQRQPALIRDWSLAHIGCVLEPCHLFSSMIDRIRDGVFSVRDLERAVAAIASSAKSPEAQAAFEGIFDSLNLNDLELGREEAQRNHLISAVLEKIDGIPFSAENASVDVLGTAYMILIGLFASDAGKKGGEFFTPTQFSRLCARLVCLGLGTISSACDPAMGSASMLLEIIRETGGTGVGHFYGQEKNGTTYNLARMNMIIHGIPCGQFSFYHGDTIARDHFDQLKFTVQVANPPYSQKWSADPSYLADPRFSDPGRLAPKSYEDFAFLQHMIYHMEENGRAAVLLPHGVLFRGGAEAAIRAHIVGKLNVVDAVIGLPSGCFHNTPIPVCCLVLAKNRRHPDSILFVDASRSFIPGKKMNTISDGHIDRIVGACETWTEQEKFCRPVPLSQVAANGYSLNISRYVDTAEAKPPVDLAQVQQDLARHRARCAELEKQVNEQLARLGL